MIIYIEKQAQNYPQAQKILKKFPSADIIEINNYKNIFDKDSPSPQGNKSIIIAKLCSPAVTKAPPGYGHTDHAYFFKSSLGCIYDCQYCFLKGAFKTEHMVFFVNYEDIKKQISQYIKEHSNKELWFYSSDYSDIQGMDNISGFNTEFIPFFEKFEGVNMEIRSKSCNIQSLLDIGYAPKNTEIAFSLNPQELIEKYESGTASLQKRIEAIHILLQAGFRVGIRLLPLLPVKNYKNIYAQFFSQLQKELDISSLASNFASGLLFTKKDYKLMLKKYPQLDILHYLELEDDSFYKESREVRRWFYTEIKKMDHSCLLCLENNFG